MEGYGESVWLSDSMRNLSSLQAISLITAVDCHIYAHCSSTTFTCYTTASTAINKVTYLACSGGGPDWPEVAARGLRCRWPW